MTNEKALSKSITVEFGNGEKVEVKKLALGQYAKLMMVLKNLPTSVMDELQNIDTDDNDATIQALFGVFGEAWGQILDVISIGSGVERERLEEDENIGLDGGVSLLVAIYEVNNLKNVVGKVKNVMTGAAK